MEIRVGGVVRGYVSGRWTLTRRGGKVEVVMTSVVELVCSSDVGALMDAGRTAICVRTMVRGTPNSIGTSSFKVPSVISLDRHSG